MENPGGAGHWAKDWAEYTSDLSPTTGRVRLTTTGMSASFDAPNLSKRGMPGYLTPPQGGQSRWKQRQIPPRGVARAVQAALRSVVVPPSLTGQRKSERHTLRPTEKPAQVERGLPGSLGRDVQILLVESISTLPGEIGVHQGGELPISSKYSRKQTHFHTVPNHQ